jgi:hypothetical protein
MPDIALRPRSPTEIVDAAFQLARRDPIPVITGLALVYVPWLIISSLSGLAMDLSDLASFQARDMTWFLFGSGLAYLLGTSITTCLANDAYFGRDADLRGAFQLVARRFGSIVVAMVITGLILAGGYFVLFMAGFILLMVAGAAALATPAMVTILFIVLVPAGIFAYCRVFATKQTILLEARGGAASIRRSWKLTKGNAGHVLLTLGLALLLNLAVGFGTNMAARLVPSVTVQQVVATIVICVMYPLVGVIQTMLYYDLRIRREGFDIEYLASVAPAPPVEQSAST